MRRKTPNLLPLALLVSALAAPAAMFDSNHEAAAFAGYDEKDKNRNKDKDKDHRKGDEDRRAQSIPPGHLPPPGECRVWYDGDPPGHQPPPTDCATAERESRRTGGRVIYGGDRHDDRWDEDDRWGDDRRDRDRWDDHDRWDDTRWLRDFETLDRNNDGYLSRRESSMSSARFFNLLDTNDDGRLSRNEVRNALPQGREQDWFRESDVNRDGRLGAREWWGRYETFERLDRNNDGYLILREILAGSR